MELISRTILIALCSIKFVLGGFDSGQVFNLRDLDFLRSICPNQPHIQSNFKIKIKFGNFEYLSDYLQDLETLNTVYSVCQKSSEIDTQAIHQIESTLCYLEMIESFRNHVVAISESDCYILGPNKNGEANIEMAGVYLQSCASLYQGLKHSLLEENICSLKSYRHLNSRYNNILYNLKKFTDIFSLETDNIRDEKIKEDNYLLLSDIKRFIENTLCFNLENCNFILEDDNFIDHVNALVDIYSNKFESTKLRDLFIHYREPYESILNTVINGDEISLDKLYLNCKFNQGFQNLENWLISSVKEAYPFENIVYGPIFPDLDSILNSQIENAFLSQPWGQNLLKMKNIRTLFLRILILTIEAEKIKMEITNLEANFEDLKARLITCQLEKRIRFCNEFNTKANLNPEEMELPVTNGNTNTLNSFYTELCNSIKQQNNIYDDIENSIIITINNIPEDSTQNYFRKYQYNFRLLNAIFLRLHFDYVRCGMNDFETRLANGNLDEGYLMFYNDNLEDYNWFAEFYGYPMKSSYSGDDDEESDI